MTEFAVIIPAYNEESYLGGTIASVRKAMDQMPAAGEIIVVDNNSSDDTARVAEEAGADRVVFEPHNQIARARNAGASRTRAEKLVFVDADTLICSEVLQKALDLLDSGSVAGGGARIVMDRPASPMVEWLVGSWNTVSARFHYAAGSFFFVRRDAFDEVGGFDETVYAGEEVWLARRLKRWAKKRGMRFQVIADPPVFTSSRKSDWFTTWDFVRQLAFIFLIPRATRSRRLCSMWYSRPKSGS